MVVLTPGVNFTNVSCAAVTLVCPKTPNDTANLTVFFAHLGSASVKAARRTLMKLSPDVKFSIVNCC